MKDFKDYKILIINNRSECDHLLGPAAGALLMTAAQSRPASQSRSRSLRAWAWLRWTRINTSITRLSRHHYE